MSTTESPHPQDAVVQWLANHDATCPVCDYGLHGVPQPACPECNAPLHLQIASIQSSPGPWLLAMGAWTLALGFDGVVALIFNTVLVIARPPLTQLFPYIFAGTFTVLVIAGIIGITHVLRSKSKWAAKPRKTQWRHAILTFITVAAVHLAVGTTIILSG